MKFPESLNTPSSRKSSRPQSQLYLLCSLRPFSPLANLRRRFVGPWSILKVPKSLQLKFKKMTIFLRTQENDDEEEEKAEEVSEEGAQQREVEGGEAEEEEVEEVREEEGEEEEEEEEEMEGVEERYDPPEEPEMLEESEDEEVVDGGNLLVDHRAKYQGVGLFSSPDNSLTGLAPDHQP